MDQHYTYTFCKDWAVIHIPTFRGLQPYIAQEHMNQVGKTKWVEVFEAGGAAMKMHRFVAGFSTLISPLCGLIKAQFLREPSRAPWIFMMILPSSLESVVCSGI